MGGGLRDDGAFRDVVVEHRDPALRLAWLLMGDRDEAEEVVAEVFAEVWVRWRRGRVVDVGPYVRRAVVNRSRSWWRRRVLERRVARRRTADHRGERRMDDQTVDREVLTEALMGLTARQREIVVCRYYQDLSVADTATLLGISPGTVKSTASRALASLAPVLAARDSVTKEAS